MSIELRPYSPSFFSDSNKNNGLIEVIKNEWIKYLDLRELKLLSFTNRELYQIFFDFFPKLLIEKASKLPVDLRDLYLNPPFNSFHMLWLIKKFRECDLIAQNQKLASLIENRLTPDPSASYVKLHKLSKSFFYQGLKEGIISWDQVKNYSLPRLELLCSREGLDGLRYRVFDCDYFFSTINQIAKILNPIPDLGKEKGNFIIFNFPAIAFQVIKNSFEPFLLKSLTFAQAVYILSPYAREHYKDAIDKLSNHSDYELIESFRDHKQSKAFLLNSIYRTTIPEGMIEIAFENLLNGLKNGKNIKSIIGAISDKIMPLKQEDAGKLTDYNPYITPQIVRKNKAGTFFVQVPTIIIDSETSTTDFSSDHSATKPFNSNQADFLSPQVNRKRYSIPYFSQQRSATTEESESSSGVTEDSRIEIQGFKTPQPGKRN